MKGQKVLILLPCFEKIQTLLSLHLKQEFERHFKNIKVDNVKVDEMFKIDERDLMAKMVTYKDHHIFFDELAIHDDRDIALLKKVDEKCKSVSVWMAITHLNPSRNLNIEDKLKTNLGNFEMVKNELSLPLRNTAPIAKQAYNPLQGKGPFSRLYIH